MSTVVCTNIPSTLRNTNNDATSLIDYLRPQRWQRIQIDHNEFDAVTAQYGIYVAFGRRCGAVIRQKGIRAKERNSPLRHFTARLTKWIVCAAAAFACRCRSPLCWRMLSVKRNQMQLIIFSERVHICIPHTAAVTKHLCQPLVSICVTMTTAVILSDITSNQTQAHPQAHSLRICTVRV